MSCSVSVAPSAVESSQLEPQGVVWRGAPQERLLDWSSSLASQHLSDEAPGVFTITDRKVGLVLAYIFCDIQNCARSRFHFGIVQGVKHMAQYDNHHRCGAFA